MAFSTAQHRLYLGYDTGAVRQIDVNAAAPAEVAFASLAAAVTSLGSAGNFLIAQAGSYSYDGGFILNSNGAVTDQGGYYYGYSRETAWDSVTSRLYFTRDGISPNDLHYDVIDQATGLVTSSVRRRITAPTTFSLPFACRRTASSCCSAAATSTRRTG
jgi:hypothetical protein